MPMQQSRGVEFTAASGVPEATERDAGGLEPATGGVIAGWKRLVHGAVLATMHCSAFLVSYAISYGLRFDFRIPNWAAELFLETVPWVVGVKLVVFYCWGNYRGWLRHITFPDLLVLLRGAVLSSLAIAALSAFLLVKPQIPRSILVFDFLLTIFALGGLRCLGRFSCEQVKPAVQRFLTGERSVVRVVLVTNDLSSGEALARQMHRLPSLNCRIVGFLHPDRNCTGTQFAGIPVLGTPRDMPGIVDKTDELLVLSGSISGTQLRPLMEQCRDLGLTIKMVPPLEQFVGGDQTVWFREVEINDLLRREPVQLDTGVVGEVIEGRVVMVTGAGGSIGSELCRQVLRFRPSRILLVGRGENRIFAIERELQQLSEEIELVPIITDITNTKRMRRIFEQHRPDLVFHAAAHKHVPLMEANVGEAVRNNVIGTQSLADLSHEYGVGRFVLISTDKAVNPTSAMGACKHLAERYVYALSQRSETRFAVVRFGNVLGSAGSVIPIFYEQIRRGGPLTITDERMVRYFMSIPEAAQLVLQAASMGNGGEIFVLDMGEPVRIVDLAKDLIRLAGLPEDAIEVRFTGIRPGEKLFEELYFDDEHAMRTTHPKIRAAWHRMYGYDDVRQELDELRALINKPDSLIRRKFRELIPEYSGGRVESSDTESASLQSTSDVVSGEQRAVSADA